MSEVKVRDKPCQTLVRQDIDCNCGHVQRTPVLGRMVNRKPSGLTRRFSGFECAIQGEPFGRVQSVHDHNNALLGTVTIGKVFQHMGTILLGLTVGDFPMTSSKQWSRQHEEMSRFYS